MDRIEDKAHRLGMISALIVDDSVFDRRRLSRLAEQSAVDFFLREADGPEAFGTALDADRFDIIFVDLDLATSTSGMELAPIVRAHPKNADAAMIMVAGEDHAEIALEALRAGFADYIDKDSLSSAALERASVNAIQKQRLSRAADAASAQTESIEAVLSNFAEVCRNEMRPMLTRMMRQVRQMRTELGAAGLSSRNIASIEGTCARMDEFLIDLGGLAHEGRLQQASVTQQIVQTAPQTTRPAKTPRPVATITKQKRRSPSLFGRS